MLHPSTKRLIDKLSDMTRKQRVAWTEGENATVVHDTEGYRVVLTPEPHAVLLTDALGREIETCLPEEFADEVDSHGRPYSKFVAELYREASRHARGTEQAINALLAGLDAAAEPDAEQKPPVFMTPAPAIELGDAVTDETAPIESETEITAAVATLADKINAPAVPAEPPAEFVESIPEPAPEPEPEPEIVAEAAPEPEPEPVTEMPEPEPESVMDTAAPAPSVEVAPLEEEPGSFGTFAAFQSTQPARAPEPESEPDVEPEPVAETMPEPVAAAPEPEPAIEEPAPAPSVPRLTQPISLSTIPFGFGLSTAQRPGPSFPAPRPEPEEAPEGQAEARPRILIDGTVDLPESIPGEYHDDVAAEPYPPPEPQAGPRDIPGDSTPAPEPGNPRRFNPWN